MGLSMTCFEHTTFAKVALNLLGAKLRHAMTLLLPPFLMAAGSWLYQLAQAGFEVVGGQALEA